MYGTGVGRATAIAFSKAGWSIALFARRLDQLKETQALCDNPSNILPVEGDVSNEEDVLKVFRLTVEKFGNSQ